MPQYQRYTTANTAYKPGGGGGGGTNIWKG